MGKILLDYVFPIEVIEPTPAASTAFLKQVCVVAKPNGAFTEPTITLCTSKSAVEGLTDNENAHQLFNAGMSRVYILLANDLDIESILDSNIGDFYTLLISDDFSDEDISQDVTTPAVQASIIVDELTFTAVSGGEVGNDITIELIDDSTSGNEVAHAVDGVVSIHIEAGVTTAQRVKDIVEESTSCSEIITVAIESGQEAVAQSASGPTNLENGANAIVDTGTGIQFGTFDGVIGVQTQDEEVAAIQAVISNRCCFFSNETNKGKNMFWSFGKLLSNLVNWNNQQFIAMNYNDGIDELGEANNLFDARVSFVLNDSEFGNRLGFFVAGGRAIAAPYILKNLRVDLQSAAVSWISGNQPAYTLKEAALLETRLQEDVINSYISRGWVTAGTIEITLVNDNFVATGAINVAEPKALWRVFNEMRQTL